MKDSYLYLLCILLIILGYVNATYRLVKVLRTLCNDFYDCVFNCEGRGHCKINKTPEDLILGHAL